MGTESRFLIFIKKYWYLFLIVVGVIIWACWPRNTPTTGKIEKIQSEIDSIIIIKDSIDRRIDTVTKTIEITRIQYEKNRDIILNNNTGEDYEFFIKYIQSNKARLDSINNL